MARTDGPLLVFGPRSTAYDFGPEHPLTPRRFGPGIDLLRAVGAVPGLAPEPARDEELLRVHTAAYLETVRDFSADPSLPSRMGIGLSDNPAFPGMHDAAAAVAGGSIAAMEAILRGDVEHAHHPGGGLHHAMPASASGFCIYDDPALAVVRARTAGLRVMYVDLDVHHGDGVQAICLADPGAVTLSFHESGAYLFPGTGSVGELGDGAAAGTSLNVPFEPFAGDGAWLPAVRSLVPAVAAVFGPDVVVSQHGADSHAWDPLAHLRVTTTAMGEAARTVDAVAHRHAEGRWLATGGGGYDAYRVVPRTWALTWLAGAHREAPDETPVAWRERWAGEAAEYGTPGMPRRFGDDANAGRPVDEAQRAAEARSTRTVALVRSLALPRLVREAEDRGWWSPAAAVPGEGGARSSLAHAPSEARAPVVVDLDRARLDHLDLLPRVIAPLDPLVARAIVSAALAAGGRAVGAVVGSSLVGLALAAPPDGEDGGDGGPRHGRPTESLVALGVAPAWRRAGLATALLRRLVESGTDRRPTEALVTVAERDVVEPLPYEVRTAIARRLLVGAGFDVGAAPADIARHDRRAIAGALRAS